eukprot:gene15176-25202_t
MVRTVDVTVFGAGVVGLTSAIAMAEAGLTVRVIAEATGSGTTSHGSGALWRPVFAGAGSTIRWGAETYAKLAAIIARGSGEAAAAGLSYTTGCELYNTDEPDPEWKDVVSNFRRLSSKELEGSASLRLDYYLQNSRALLRPEVISRAGRLTVSQGLDLRCADTRDRRRTIQRWARNTA